LRTIVFAPEAARSFDSLDPAIRARVENGLIALAENPALLAGQIKKLKGDSALRLRVGDWRIIFENEPASILVLAIGHRRDIYR
jgi:mRNA interferase RelE/StbE